VVAGLPVLVEGVEGAAEAGVGPGLLVQGADVSRDGERLGMTDTRVAWLAGCSGCFADAVQCPCFAVAVAEFTEDDEGVGEWVFCCGGGSVDFVEDGCAQQVRGGPQVEGDRREWGSVSAAAGMSSMPMTARSSGIVRPQVTPTRPPVTRAPHWPLPARSAPACSNGPPSTRSTAAPDSVCVDRRYAAILLIWVYGSRTWSEPVPAGRRARVGTCVGEDGRPCAPLWPVG
jgi:hypothetical protein